MNYNGYENVLDQLKAFKKDDYLQLSEQGRQYIVEKVFNIYREINLFPIIRYDGQGIHKEIEKCIEKEIASDSWTDVLNLKNNQGSAVCKFLFPNLHKVDCKNQKNNSMWDRFYDDHKLKRAIDFSLRFKKSATPSEIRTSLEMIGGNVATNFKIMNAQALYERYTPKNGIIFDYACGFGGRMLGALTSKNDYTYIGVEPCTETFASLNTLGEHIEKVTNRTNSFKIMCNGSEDIQLNQTEFVDFAFSSPPYFSLEKYSDEDTQCYNKFTTLDEWFDGYVEPTIKHLYDMLKFDCYYAVNIADFNIGSERVEFVNKWVELSEKMGFEYIEQIHMKLTTRKGNGHTEDGKDKEKQEGIFVFKKTSK